MHSFLEREIFFSPPVLLFFSLRATSSNTQSAHTSGIGREGGERRGRGGELDFFWAGEEERKETIGVGGGGLLSRNVVEENWRGIFSFPRRKEKGKKSGCTSTSDDDAFRVGSLNLRLPPTHGRRK